MPRGGVPAARSIFHLWFSPRYDLHGAQAFQSRGSLLLVPTWLAMVMMATLLAPQDFLAAQGLTTLALYSLIWAAGGLGWLCARPRDGLKIGPKTAQNL